MTVLKHDDVIKRIFLKSKSTCILLNKNINLHKNETQSKNRNHDQPDSVISQNRKTEMSWSSGNKKVGIFCTVYFVRRKFFF